MLRALDIWLYVLLALGVVIASAIVGRQLDIARGPRIQLAADGRIPRIDQAVLHRSMRELMVLSQARQLGHSIRTVSGQRLPWVIHGDDGWLFADVEAWTALGPDAPGMPERLDQMAEALAAQVHRLEAEGWQVIVLPVPPKLAIHGDHCPFPIYLPDRFNRAPVRTNQSLAFDAALRQRLHRAQLRVVDLGDLYRQELGARPASILYPPGETHWSGLGLRLAAEAAAKAIASASGIAFRPMDNPAFFPVRHRCDLAAGYALHPWFPGPLAGSLWFDDLLIEGNRATGFPWPSSNPTALVVSIGTSYSGHYSEYVGHPVNFAWAVNAHLVDTLVDNQAFAGRGSFYPMNRFFDQRQEILASHLAKLAGKPPGPKVVLWEFPVRDCQDLLRLPRDPGR